MNESFCKAWDSLSISFSPPNSDCGLIHFQVPFFYLPAFPLRIQYHSLLKYLIADGEIGLL